MTKTLRKVVLSSAAASLTTLAMIAPQAPAVAAPISTGTTCPATTPATAPASMPYAPAELAAAKSVPPHTYINELSGFSTLGPSVLAKNLADAIAINNAATPAEQRYAVSDNYAIGTDAIFNALGSKLYPAFQKAMKDGKLPKTKALLIGKHALIEERVSTAAAKRHFNYKRPFEVAPEKIKYYDDPARGNLYDAVRGSGSFPSGHTAWGYSEALVIASMIPEVGPQMLGRAAQYGRHRVILGVHYPLDIVGGRMLAESAVADAMADPKFEKLFKEAKSELRNALIAETGAPIATTVKCQKNYMSTDAALALSRGVATWNFNKTGANRPPYVPANAINLIRAAHPGLSDTQLKAILSKNELQAGYPLDINGPNGGWQRLDIAAAWAH